MCRPHDRATAGELRLERDGIVSRAHPMDHAARVGQRLFDRAYERSQRLLGDRIAEPLARRSAIPEVAANEDGSSVSVVMWNTGAKAYATLGGLRLLNKPLTDPRRQRGPRSPLKDHPSIPLGNRDTTRTSGFGVTKAVDRRTPTCRTLREDSVREHPRSMLIAVPPRGVIATGEAARDDSSSFRTDRSR
jgi:hypothetical protein